MDLDAIKKMYNLDNDILLLSLYLFLTEAINDGNLKLLEDTYPLLNQTNVEKLLSSLKVELYQK